MLHEFEYLQCESLDRQAATASNIMCYTSLTYNTQVIDYDLSFITISIMFLFSIVICLVGILILLFAFHQGRSTASGHPGGIPDRDYFRGPRTPALKIKLRQK
jgi:hypothetical protein